MTNKQDPRVTLTMRPNLKMTTKMDGTGFELATGYGDHFGQLQIGNVSIAFDDRNGFVPSAGEEYSGVCIELEEFHDDPVRLNGASVGSYDDCNSAAYKILYALSKDQGYSLVKHEPNDDPSYDELKARLDRLEKAARTVCDKLDEDPLWWVSTDDLNSALKTESEG